MRVIKRWYLDSFYTWSMWLTKKLTCHTGCHTVRHLCHMTYKLMIRLLKRTEWPKFLTAVLISCNRVPLRQHEVQMCWNFLINLYGVQIKIRQGATFDPLFVKHRGYHIRLNNLVIGWHTLECNSWFWVRPRSSVTLGPWVNHIRLQHFYMILNVKCCSLIIRL